MLLPKTAAALTRRHLEYQRALSAATSAREKVELTRQVRTEQTITYWTAAGRSSDPNDPNNVAAQAFWRTQAYFLLDWLAKPAVQQALCTAGLVEEARFLEPLGRQKTLVLFKAFAHLLQTGSRVTSAENAQALQLWALFERTYLQAPLYPESLTAAVGTDGTDAPAVSPRPALQPNLFFQCMDVVEQIPAALSRGQRVVCMNACNAQRLGVAPFAKGTLEEALARVTDVGLRLLTHFRNVTVDLQAAGRLPPDISPTPDDEALPLVQYQMQYLSWLFSMSAALIEDASLPTRADFFIRLFENPIYLTMQNCVYEIDQGVDPLHHQLDVQYLPAAVVALPSAEALFGSDGLPVCLTHPPRVGLCLSQVAAPDLRSQKASGLKQLDCLYDGMASFEVAKRWDEHRRLNPVEIKSALRAGIENTLEIGLRTAADLILLCGFGCRAFLNNPLEVSQIFSVVLRAYASALSGKSIAYVDLCSENCQVFLRTFSAALLGIFNMNPEFFSTDLRLSSLFLPITAISMGFEPLSLLPLTPGKKQDSKVAIVVSDAGITPTESRWFQATTQHQQMFTLFGRSGWGAESMHYDAKSERWVSVSMLRNEATKGRPIHFIKVALESKRGAIEEELVLAYRAVIGIASTLQMTTLHTPLLGAGYHGVSPEISFAALRQALQRASSLGDSAAAHSQPLHVVLHILPQHEASCLRLFLKPEDARVEPAFSERLVPVTQQLLSP